MWLSEEWASRLNEIANVVLVVSLVVGVVATWATVRTGGIKEVYLKRDLAASHERVANLELETASLLKQLIEQGPRTHLLYGTRRDKLIQNLMPFAGQKVEVRVCRVSFNQFGVDNDTMGVAMLLQDIFEKAGWLGSPLVIENCSGTALQVTFDPSAPESAREAAKALASALREVPLALVADGAFPMAAPRSDQPPTYDHSGKLIPLRPLTNDVIVVTVFAHP